MKYISSFVFIAIILFFLINFLPVRGYAQLGDPGEDPDAQIPIDDGVVLLIAAGVGYGLKKAIENRKKNTALFEG